MTLTRLRLADADKSRESESPRKLLRNSYAELRSGYALLRKGFAFLRNGSAPEADKSRVA
ncbi:hypothetical protein DU53_07485 [Kosmotoga sp. DU53]|nr:hypothetical protein DU53_07485 [Kosmotoga sp. DU53]